MTQQLFMLSGASRGLGAAMAAQLLAAQHTVLCLSRRANPQLQQLAQSHGAALHQWCVDLSAAQQPAERLANWLAAQDPRLFDTATLINNAAVLGNPTPLGQSAPDELVQCLRVGLEAPLLLTGAFLRASADWRARRRVLNISSGLGRRAMASASAYCAVKAGLDHFTRCLTLEEAARPNGVRACSLAPGVIDTDMQLQLRQSDARDFADQPMFANLKAQGLLSSPADAARRVLAYLERADFGTEPVADVRN